MCQALVQFSIDLHGLDSSTGKPQHLIRLRERPDHSKYAECRLCAKNRKLLEEALARREPLSVIQGIHAKQLVHVEENFSERRVIATARNETLRCSTSVFSVDDKSGSAWHFLPMPDNQRESKDTTSNYKYKMCLQGNFYPSRGNFYCFVPPFLHTGGNFGCTSFVTTLYELIHAGKLDHRVSKLMRQTDGGSDNVSWVTFALHAMLIREGVLNQLDWVRLRPGHSHNECDSNHRLALGVFYPRKGVGKGCETPFEFEQRLVDGLKGLNGGLEMLWQLANFNFEAWLQGFVHKDFGNYENQRWVVFKYDPTLTSHGYVRVTYKTNITDVATSTSEEWKPHIPAPEDSLLERVSEQPHSAYYALPKPCTHLCVHTLYR